MSNQSQLISPLWIVLYLTLHLLWRQFFPNSFSPSGAYLILPFSFLALLIVVKGRGLGRNGEQLVGRWLPRRTDLSISVAFIVAAVALRLLLGWCFGLSPLPKKLALVADLAALAPLNEELIFRGLILGILLTRLPRQPWVAVIWSAAIFLSFHSFAGDDVPAVAGVFSLGLLSGSAYASTRCIPLCIACHALYNTLGWCRCAPRIMTVSDVWLGLGFFVFGVAVIAWLLRLCIRRQRRGIAQQDIAANRNQPVESGPNQTPSPAGSGG